MNTNNYNPDVLSCLANLSNDEVFTPPTIANQMLDLLPEKLWSDKNATFLDPVCKSGVFLREITKRLNEGLKKQIPDQQKRINHILTKQVFGIALTELTSILSRRTLYCSKNANSKYSICSDFKDEQGNLFYEKTQHQWQNGKCVFCGASQSVYDRDETFETYAYPFIHENNPFKNMKFDVIIGNPPYQMTDGGGTGSSAVPLYHKFVEQAKKMQPRFLTMIIPSRWFTGGKGLDNFRDAMLNDDAIREIHDYLNAGDVFAGVSIEGGVCYFLWDRDNKGLCKVVTHSGDDIVSHSVRPLLEDGADVFIRYNPVISILRKVMAHKENRFSQIVSPRNPYGFEDDFIENAVCDNEGEACAVLGIENKKRVVKQLPLKLLQRNKEELKFYRLFVSKADGAAGQIGYPVPARIIGKVVIAEPQMACTGTFLRIGSFKNEKEAERVRQYMQTKFFRLLVGARKNKNMTQSTYSFVPIQNWDEDWTDEKLYKKYKLTKDEIAFIESMISPMEI